MPRNDLALPYLPGMREQRLRAVQRRVPGPRPCRGAAATCRLAARQALLHKHTTSELHMTGIVGVCMSTLYLTRAK